MLCLCVCKHDHVCACVGTPSHSVWQLSCYLRAQASSSLFSFLLPFHHFRSKTGSDKYFSSILCIYSFLFFTSSPRFSVLVKRRLTLRRHCLSNGWLVSVLPFVFMSTCRSQHRLCGDGCGSERCGRSSEGLLRWPAWTAHPLQSAPWAGGRCK